MKKLICVMSMLAIVNTSFAQDMTAADLIEMEFDELVNLSVRIESAGKSETKALDLAYAGYVISAEDIRASGVQTIPDALRLAPGVEVGQISAAEWSVGIRGAGGRYSRYVLVMVDGRVVYNYVFAGVNWDELNINLNSIERIEVIRGPNASTWGANAVNGIIHIITQSPDNKGASEIAVTAGGQGHKSVNVNWNTEVGDHWHVGLGANASQWDGLKNRFDEETDGQHHNSRISFSASRNVADNITRISADVFQMRQNPMFSWFNANTLTFDELASAEKKNGYSVQGAHTHNWSSSGYWKIRGSAESTSRDAAVFLQDSSNYQLDLDFGLKLGVQKINGGIYSRATDSTVYFYSDIDTRFDPPKRRDSGYGIYFNYVVDVIEAWELAVGARIDDSDLSKVTVQPSLRSLWRIGDTQRFWLALSEAASTPPRTVVDVQDLPYIVLPPQQQGFPPTLITLNGYAEQQDSPRLKAIELGYRKAFLQSSFDLALFQYEYMDELFIIPARDPYLLTLPSDQTIAVQPMIFDNQGSYTSRGGEFVFRQQIIPSWAVQLNLSYIEFVEGADSSSTTANLINTFDVTESLKGFLALRYNEGITELSTRIDSNALLYGEADDYLVMDATLRWSINSNWQVDFIARNLGQSHAEALREDYSATILQVEPNALINLGFRF